MKLPIIVGVLMLGMGIIGIIKSPKDLIAIIWVILGIIFLAGGITQYNH